MSTNVSYVVTYHSNLLRLPLRIGYARSLGKHIEVGANVGPSVNYLVNIYSTNTQDQSRHDESLNYRSVGVGVTAGMHATYNFTHRFGLMLSPVYAYIPNKKFYSGPERFNIFGVRLAAGIQLAK